MGFVANRSNYTRKAGGCAHAIARPPRASPVQVRTTSAEPCKFDRLGGFAGGLWVTRVLRSSSRMAAVWAAKRDHFFVEVVRRHVRYPAHLGS
jgi:hypothetical protein